MYRCVQGLGCIGGSERVTKAHNLVWPRVSSACSLLGLLKAFCRCPSCIELATFCMLFDLGSTLLRLCSKLFGNDNSPWPAYAVARVSTLRAELFMYSFEFVRWPCRWSVRAFCHQIPHKPPCPVQRANLVSCKDMQRLTDSRHATTSLTG